MNWSKWCRQFHRWLSITFVVAVIANFAVFRMDERVRFWVGSLTLAPLALLMITGLYLFALPYIDRP